MSIVTAKSLHLMLEDASEQKRAKIIGRALVALFNRQTEDEQSSNDTRKWNAVGFSGADARTGSLTAKYFLKHGSLLDWQVAKWMKVQRNGMPRLCKYYKQLNEVAQEKARAAK